MGRHGGTAQGDCTVGLYNGTVQGGCTTELHIGQHNRLTISNIRFLRAHAPAAESKDAGPPGSQDIGMEYMLDSAWGAREQMNRSADSNNGPGGGPTYGEMRTQDAAPLYRRNDNQGLESYNSRGDEGAVAPGLSQ